MQADRLVKGLMCLPTNNKALTRIRGTYTGILGQVKARKSRFVKVKVPRAAPVASAGSGSGEAL